MQSHQNDSPSKELTAIKDMFGRLAPRYDLANRALSLGRDRSWRLRAALLAQPGQGGVALDVGTGTGDMAVLLVRRAARVFAMDVSGEMLERARRKAEAAGVAHRVHFLLANATSLPFLPETFDCVTMAFSIRSVADLDEALSEAFRVSKPGGRLVCLEFNPPPPGLAGVIYRPYLRYAVPFLGWVVTGDRSAYRYLGRSIYTFPPAAELRGRMKGAGFKDALTATLNMGTVAIHLATKSSVAAGAQNIQEPMHPT